MQPFTIEQLVQIAAGLQGGKMLAGRGPHALEALRTVVDAKLAAQTHALMVKLDEATTRLQHVGVNVGKVGVLVMVGQLVVAMVTLFATMSR